MVVKQETEESVYDDGRKKDSLCRKEEKGSIPDRKTNGCFKRKTRSKTVYEGRKLIRFFMRKQDAKTVDEGSKWSDSLPRK